MLAGKILTDYKNLFSPHDLKKYDTIILLISKMNKCNSIFSLSTRITKKLLNITRKKRKSMIEFLCRLKVNSIVLKH